MELGRILVELSQPLRFVFLDTETTGLEVREGHRIIEIAAVEMINRQLTGSTYHEYIDPQRDIDPAAEAVHGISLNALEGKPVFKDISIDFCRFIKGAELIIHNASFDIGFINSELMRAGLNPVEEYCPVITDSLRLARELHPGQRNSLDALCKRYGVDNSSRTLHGALLDAGLLAEVYLAMTRGQANLVMDTAPISQPSSQEGSRPLPDVYIVKANDNELSLHQAQLLDIQNQSDGACVWFKNKL
ncbi:MAG: DNA polymerase III subunit epsilon [Proteobacteria bacterium]|nr:DNA polymerase III subunit epsilon [Pseudomonadota bacterium]MDE3207695.1 DNA polymerase III subunit epsilon [Pseudomonadota bacterium]